MKFRIGARIPTVIIGQYGTIHKPALCNVMRDFSDYRFYFPDEGDSGFFSADFTAFNDLDAVVEAYDYVYGEYYAGANCRNEDSLHIQQLIGNTWVSLHVLHAIDRLCSI